MSVWVNKRVEKLLRVWCCEVMISLRTETKTELRHNMCDDIIVKEECCIQCKVERCSLIMILDSTLF